MGLARQLGEPESIGRPQPVAHHRPAARRDGEAAPQVGSQSVARADPRHARQGDHAQPPIRRGPLPSSAIRGDASALRDRYGHGHEARVARPRRADDGTRRHYAGGSTRPHTGAQGRVRIRSALHHARPGRHFAHMRPGGRHVRWRDLRASAYRRSICQASPSLHSRSARLYLLPVAGSRPCRARRRCSSGWCPRPAARCPFARVRAGHRT